MRPWRTGAILLGLAMVTGTFTIAPAAASDHDTMEFGMDASSISAQASAGVAPDYGTFWVGPWTLDSGWGGIANQMQSMRNAGVTPAIHLYYWGDDISPHCLENGCWSNLHNTHKDKAGWDRLTNELIHELNSNMNGEPVVILLETEFNQNGAETHEALDGYLADKAYQIQGGYSNAEVVLAFGNWGHDAWSNFDRAANAADYIGVQGMSASTRDALWTYQNLFEDVVYGAERAQDTFGERVFITDIALSSYPEPDYLDHQADSLSKFFHGMDRLKDAGAEAMIYRSWHDAPTKDPNNYYGYAERHWGLSYADGNWKPAADVWVQGVQAERGGSSSGDTYEPGDLKVDWQLGEGVGEWWIEVYANANNPIDRVRANVDGQWHTLDRQDWGSWADSFHIPSGTPVYFEATDTHGQTVTSNTIAWLDGSSPESTDTPQEPEPTDDTFQVDWTLADGVNEWWIEVFADSNQPIDRVRANVDGEWHTLHKQSWGAWADSFHIPSGSQVYVDARSTDGETVTSNTISWLGGSSDTSSSTTSSDEAFQVDWTLADGVNEWWIEVFADSNQPIDRVRANVDGEWHTLHKQSWGAWADSFHIPSGSQVYVDARSTDGETVTSNTISWLGGSVSTQSSETTDSDTTEDDETTETTDDGPPEHAKANGRR